MFNFSKSIKPSADLQNKSTVQHRVLCDWLRNIDKKLTQLARRQDYITKTLDSLLEDQLSSPSGEQDVQNDNSTDSQSI